MPIGIKGFQKGHKHFLTREQQIAIGKSRLGAKHSEEAKRKIGESNKKAFAEGRKSVKGEKNPSWKGGITEEIVRLRKSWAYRAWRNMVYARDRWTCQICLVKCRAKNIVAHHLKLFSTHSHLRFNTANGQTLCRSCHARLHKLTEFGY